MSLQTVAVVDWYGPFPSIKKTREAARMDFDEGLYMLISRQKLEKNFKLRI